MPQRLDSAKQLAIISWIETALSITAIWNDQNALRPALPFVSVNIISGPTPDGTYQVNYKELDTYTYLFRKLFTLSIQAFSTTNHLALLSILTNSINLPTHRSTLRAAGLAVYNETDIVPVNISELLETGMEKRGSIDVNMAYSEEVDDIPGEIQTTKIAGISGTKFENVDLTIEGT